MAERTCSRPDCDRSARARGLCWNHYQQWWRVNRASIPKFTVAERFWVKVDKGDGTGCWLWTATKLKHGYGQFGIGGHKRVYAHRFAYELMVGPIPDGLQLDHIKERCTSKLCVKVIDDEFSLAHLEPVTHRENILRGDGITARNARKTHCKRDHPFTGANTYIRPNGSRQCIICSQARYR